jgi:hypothetical protein
MSSSPDRRLLRDLTAVGALVDDARPSARERLAATVGREPLRELRSQLAAQCPGARRRLLFERLAARLARLGQWQWSVLIVSLGCGAAVSMMGVIELIWQLRSVLSGIGAVAVVLTVFLKTRRYQRLAPWIGS